MSTGADDGLLPDDSGDSITPVQDDRYVSCAATGSGRLADAGCPNRAADRPPRTWASASA